MAGIRRLEWNEQVKNAAYCGAYLAIAAIAATALARSNYRFRPESRKIFRNIAIITGTFSFACFALAYGLVKPLPVPPRSSTPSPESPDDAAKRLASTHEELPKVEPEDAEMPIYPFPHDYPFEKLKNEEVQDRVKDKKVKYKVTFYNRIPVVNVAPVNRCLWRGYLFDIEELQVCFQLGEKKEKQWQFPMLTYSQTKLHSNGREKIKEIFAQWEEATALLAQARK